MICQWRQLLICKYQAPQTFKQKFNMVNYFQSRDRLEAHEFRVKTQRTLYTLTRNGDSKNWKQYVGLDTAILHCLTCLQETKKLHEESSKYFNAINSREHIQRRGTIADMTRHAGPSNRILKSHQGNLFAYIRKNVWPWLVQGWRKSGWNSSL